jgi:sulfur-oxidizing protein SoxY
MNLTNRHARRRILALFAGSMLGSLVGTRARATTESAAQWMQPLLEGVQPRDGRITIQAPDIAENGNNVPVTVSVESPMTEADHVKAIHVIADGNPVPGAASFFLGPANGKAEVQLRIRLAQTQNVIALAQMSDGSVWRSAREVKVAIGGCGG